MKFVTERSFADPDRAARKLLEIANSLEPYMDQRLLAELLNAPFLPLAEAPPNTRPDLNGRSTRAGSGGIVPAATSSPRRPAPICSPDAVNGWKRRYDPISLPSGRLLVTLHDGVPYITTLPQKESDLPEWEAAIEALMLDTHLGGPRCLSELVSCEH